MNIASLSHFSSLFKCLDVFVAEMLLIMNIVRFFFFEQIETNVNKEGCLVLLMLSVELCEG